MTIGRSAEWRYSGMAAVVPAWALAELLNEDGIRMKRERADAELSKLDEREAILHAPDTAELERTADLMGQLVQVPKHETDEVHRGHLE